MTEKEQQQKSLSSNGLEPVLTKEQGQEQEQQQLQAAEQAKRQAEQDAEAAAEAARRAARTEALRRYEDLNMLRLEPLGMDRRFNRYWLLVAPDFSISSSYRGAATDTGPLAAAGERVSCGVCCRGGQGALSEHPLCGWGGVNAVCLVRTGAHWRTGATCLEDAF